jgi:hypothetical protein
MGVIVTEDVPLDMGLSIDKYYAALGTNEARVQKRVDTQRAYGEDGAVTESTTTEYVIEGLFQKWISKEARDAGSRPFAHQNVRITQATAPVGNIYDMLYTKLKEGLVYVQDA